MACFQIHLKYSCCLQVLQCAVIFQPVGALNPARLSHLQERFDSWEEDRVPPFFYGTHYSTMAFVLHWLVRVVSHVNLFLLYTYDLLYVSTTASVYVKIM